MNHDDLSAAAAEAAELLIAAFEAASKKVRQQLGTNSGGGKAESAYGAAYQRLVKAGLQPKVRLRMRGA